MTATSVGLNGNPVKFLGAYVRSASESLGLSTSPGSANITLAEDVPFGVVFEPPVLGSFHTISIGPTWQFSGLIKKYDKDIENISGRQIRVVMNDVREIMRSIPIILAPGAQNIAFEISKTQCSLIDVFGAYAEAGGALNLSGWNQAGMPYNRVASALNGDNITFGETIIPIERQIAKAFGERYRFNFDEITAIVDPNYRINTNLVPISNLIEDLSSKYSFDWFIDAVRASDGIIDVTIKIIDRSTDNIDIGLQEFLDEHDGKVISATSGVELRNDISCMVLQGAPIEQMERVGIKGLANEPLDLSSESGSNKYVMVEREMRAVLAGKFSWEMWVNLPVANDGGGGFGRYGGALSDDHLSSPIDLDTISEIRAGQKLTNAERDEINLDGAFYANSGKVFEKLKGHAETAYGKRWVHEEISDIIIESAWTRDVVAGNENPNEYFRQSDGRTRAYVEFTNDDLSTLGFELANTQTLFGNIDVFSNVTVFGTTFQNVLPGQPGQNGAILTLESFDNFNAGDAVIDADKTSYTYDDTATGFIIGSGGALKSSLYVAATVDKDGVIKLESPVLFSKPDFDALLVSILNAAPPAGESETSEQATLDAATEDLEDATAAAEDAGEVLNEVVERGDTDSIPDAEAAFDDALAAESAAIDAFLDARDARDDAEAGLDLENPNEMDADKNEGGALDNIALILKRVFGETAFSLFSESYQPKFAYIPVRSRFNRYGPVFSEDITNDAQGKLEILQDDGFSPWEFGGNSNMITSMQLKVNNASSLQREIFTGNVNVEGFPIRNTGDSIDKNANINSISISFSTQGVTTTYGFSTFTRKFGEFSKEDWARIALFANSGATRVLPQTQINFTDTNSFKVNKNMTGRGTGGSSSNSGGAISFG